MPYSTPVFEKQLLGLIEEVKPLSIIDVGVGAGRMSTIARPSNCKLIGYEVNKSYGETFKEWHSKYDNVIYKDFYEAILDDDIEADIFVFGDVLEHIPTSRVIDILDYCSYRCQAIFIASPMDYRQGSYNGQSSERHISSLRLSDMSRFNIAEYSKKKFTDGMGTHFMQLFIIQGLGWKG
jgi:2-polyprenyl-3-methyl-5-hydroxy-6-metoxy-1,4-benzoquinol methylase